MTQVDKMKGEDKDDFLQKELWNLYYLHSYHKSLDWQTENAIAFSSFI